MTAEASKMAARMEIASSGQPAWRTERFGHPIGLPVLFSVEMWERFSFYGMRSILVLYLRSELLPSAAFDECVGAGVVKSLVGGSPTTPGEVQRAASTIYGLYTGFNYLTPLIGGYAADKWLGKKLCVASGLAVMGIGHFLMVVPSLFFVGLVLIVCGSGLFKPNMSVQLGGLYPAGDSRRDRAFSIFYMGVNLGAFFSPLVVGTIGDPSVLGYRVGFSIAGFGMCAGLLTYCSLGRYLPPADLATTGPAAGEEASDADEGGSGGSVVDKADAQKRLLALLLVCVTLVPYTIAYEQQGNTIQIFFDDHVDRSLPTVAGLFGLGSDWRIPSAWLQAVNPLLILTMTPLLTRTWKWQSAEPDCCGGAVHCTEQDTISKLAWGHVMVGLSFLFLSAAGYVLGPDISGATVEPAAAAGGAAGDAVEEERVSFMWVLAHIMLITLGELHVQPVGLSFISRFAPEGYASIMMGVWYTGAFGGSLTAGILGRQYSVMSIGGFYLLVAMVGTANGGLMVLLTPMLQRWVQAGGQGDPSGGVVSKPGQDQGGGGGSRSNGGGEEQQSLLSAGGGAAGGGTASAGEEP